MRCSLLFGFMLGRGSTDVIIIQCKIKRCLAVTSLSTVHAHHHCGNGESIFVHIIWYVMYKVRIDKYNVAGLSSPVHVQGC